MPWGNARSLSADETYAVVAFLLNLNDIVGDDFELNDKNLTFIKLPNAAGFFADDRETSEKTFWNKNPCMQRDQDLAGLRLAGCDRALDLRGLEQGGRGMDGDLQLVARRGSDVLGERDQVDRMRIVRRISCRKIPFGLRHCRQRKSRNAGGQRESLCKF